MEKVIAGWYLIYTKPRCEKRVTAGLSEINITAYLPTSKKVRIWHDRKKVIDEPLFPSYVFTYVNDLKSFYDCLAVDGALYYVRSGKEVAKVSETVINNIRLVTNAESDIEVTSMNFQPGRQYVIQEGPLTGLSCEIAEYKSEEKILVRVNLLQRSILVSMPSKNLISSGSYI